MQQRMHSLWPRGWAGVSIRGSHQAPASHPHPVPVLVPAACVQRYGMLESFAASVLQAATSCMEHVADQHMLGSVPELFGLDLVMQPIAKAAPGLTMQLLDSFLAFTKRSHEEFTRRSQAQADEGWEGSCPAHQRAMMQSQDLCMWVGDLASSAQVGLGAATEQARQRFVGRYALLNCALKTAQQQQQQQEEEGVGADSSERCAKRAKTRLTSAASAWTAWRDRSAG